MATHSQILAWEIPWTEEPAGLYSPWGCKESDMTEHAHTHTHAQRAEDRRDLTAWASVPGLASPSRRVGHFWKPGVGGQPRGAVRPSYHKGQDQAQSSGLTLQGPGHSRICHPWSVSMEPGSQVSLKLCSLVVRNMGSEVRLFKSGLCHLQSCVLGQVRSPLWACFPLCNNINSAQPPGLAVRTQ